MDQPSSTYYVLSYKKPAGRDESQGAGYEDVASRRKKQTVGRRRPPTRRPECRDLRGHATAAMRHSGKRFFCSIELGVHGRMSQSTLYLGVAATVDYCQLCLYMTPSGEIHD